MRGRCCTRCGTGSAGRTSSTPSTSSTSSTPRTSSTSSTPAPACIFRTPGAGDDVRVLRDARRLSNGLVAVTTDAGLKLHSRNHHSWYGVAGYAIYSLNDWIAIQGRAEYFNDDDGARGLGTTLYEFTFGVDIKPLASNKDFATLRVRPEIRWDLSDDDVFDGGQDTSKLTFGIDVLFQF